jgi:toxin-antitoxin system PIN domain toxin
MILPDVNVLVYAYRPDAPNHVQSRKWLDHVADSVSAFGISKLTLSAFVRIVTNPRIHDIPTPLDAAFAFCDALLGQPNCTIVEPGPRHWAIFRNVCLATNTRGKNTTDAWFAALAIESGCEWVTFDRDFTRFPGLKCTILSASNN